MNLTQTIDGVIHEELAKGKTLEDLANSDISTIALERLSAAAKKDAARVGVEQRVRYRMRYLRDHVSPLPEALLAWRNAHPEASAEDEREFINEHLKKLEERRSAEPVAA